MNANKDDILETINEHIIDELKKIDEEESKKLNILTRKNLKPSAKPKK